jgi:hypothetical protein
MEQKDPQSTRLLRQWPLQPANISQYFSVPSTHLVHDPNNSLVLGDVITLHKLRVSTIVHHVVGDLVTPFGKPASDRPPIPTADERLAIYKQKRFAKLHRRALRRRAATGNAEAIKELRSMGLDPGKGVEAGKGETANTQKGIGKKRIPTPGAILGNQGQKLPEGILPGGKHEVGPINVRARENRSKADIMARRAEENLMEAEVKDQQLAEQDLEGESAVGARQSNVRREGVKENPYGKRG